MSVYPFIEAEKAQQRNVKRACELLEVGTGRAAGGGCETARQVAPAEPGQFLAAARPSAPGRAANHLSRGA